MRQVRNYPVGNLESQLPRVLQTFSRKLQYPTCLKALPGFIRDHIKRALLAAKDLQLEMKLRNMPVPLAADLVDQYLAPLLEAAAAGDLGMVREFAGE